MAHYAKLFFKFAASFAQFNLPEDFSISRWAPRHNGYLFNNFMS